MILRSDICTFAVRMKTMFNKLKPFCLIGTLVFSAAAMAQTGSKVIFTYQNNPVTVEEFEYQYLKNKKIGEEVITEADIDEYLDLYIKFKLKYQDARDAGMDTLPDYIAELAGYRSQLARNYLFDKEVTDALISEAYNRMKSEVRAAHILVAVDADAKPSDSLAAYNKIKKAYESIISGKSTFEAEARSISDDPGSKDNGGDLGYFTALQLVYPFENVAYQTSPGKVSQIFRTQFGYHIVKVLDVRNNRGDIKVKHIQLRVGHRPEATTEAVQKQIDEIYNKIVSGESGFDKMAYSYSEDYNSKYQGGEMDFVNTTQFVGDPEKQRWVDVAFSLQNDGDISKPFRTNLGWHILQRVQIRPLGTFDQLKNVIKNQVRNDQRSQKSLDALVKKVERENNFIRNKAALDALIGSLDTNYTNGNFKKSNLPKFAKTGATSKPVKGPSPVKSGTAAQPLLEMELFQIADEKHLVEEFADYLEKNKRKVYGSIDESVKNHFEEWIADLSVKFQDKHLEEKSSEFKNIFQEYSEGILMFYRKKELVWDRANSDSTGLANYFAAHRNEYLWKDRIHAEVYFCGSQDLMKKVAKQVKKGINSDTIKARHNRVKPLSVDYKIGKYEATDNYLFADKKLLKDVFDHKKSKKAKSVIQMGQYGDDWVLVKIVDFLPAGPKELNETRGPVTAKYEEYLEDLWIKDLQNRYTVSVDSKVLSDFKKKLINR